MVVQSDVLGVLGNLGARADDLVDLSRESGSRILPYLDLLDADGGAPIVFESQGQPRAYIFDGTQIGDELAESIKRWRRRIAFREDADWVGVASVGRVDFYRASLEKEESSERAKPIPLGQGPLLLPSLLHYSSKENQRKNTVRHALLSLLNLSIKAAVEAGVPPRDALSLVGRAIFWRFLIDREILEEGTAGTICRGAKSLTECLEDKANSLQTFAWMDRVFNGGLLSFSSPTAAEQISEATFHKVVGGIAHGATPDGQLPLRLPREWREVDFSHIPVGLLSEVYEAYAHSNDEQKAKEDSVHYTPREIAEFTIGEAIAALGEVKRPRILDPAAGAGVFLVASFRALVGREWNTTGQRPSRVAVRKILDEQITGFDINEDALRLAELSLYLTALELDPDPRPPVADLHFNKMRERTLFLLDRDQGGSLGPVPEEMRGKFDLVLGNPPWTAISGKGRGINPAWNGDTRALIKERLGPERAAAFSFADSNPDIPFLFRAMEWAREGGTIALITHARWLFVQMPASVKLRQDILESVQITGILNGSALRDTSVWEDVRAPFCIVFARNVKPTKDSTFQFITPALEEGFARRQRHMRIDWQDARDIRPDEVISKPWLLKVRYRGTAFDESAMSSIMRRGTPLEQYLERFGVVLRNGYKAGAEHLKNKKPSNHMAHLPDYGRQVKLVPCIDVSGLPLFASSELSRPREPETYLGPLLVITESMLASPTAIRAGFCRSDLAYDERFTGASFFGVREGEQIARYLQLYFQSSLYLYVCLFTDPQYGIEREVVHSRTIKKLPVVPLADLTPLQLSRANGISHEFLRLGRLTASIKREIDALMFDIFGLYDVERSAVFDALRTALPTAAGMKEATRSTTLNDRRDFASVCQSELREALVQRNQENISVTALIAGAESLGSWRFIRVALDATKRPLDAFRLSPFIARADDLEASLITMRMPDKSLLVGIVDKYRYWTPTRARLLAATIVAGRVQ